MTGTADPETVALRQNGAKNAPERRRAKAVWKVHCAVCPQSFETTNQRAKYCTNACKQTAYRRTEREKRAARVREPDSGVLKIASMGQVADFCTELGTLAAWDEGDPDALARAHGQALELALKLLKRDE